MKLLIPLGLLGLLSIIVLIIIYVIKPNYQQKTVSSTFVWKLSLKYKKKRIPVSKLRNIIIVLCQIAILAFLALILARPANVDSIANANKNEVVAIIDSSASMRTETNGITRFERAVAEVRKTVDGALDKGGKASVIVADDKPYFLFERLSSDNSNQIDKELSELNNYEKYCSYGKSNSDAAIELCDTVLTINSDASIYYYTDVTYSYVPDGVTIVPVQDLSEWNAAILGASVEMIDNFCAISVDVACYNRDSEIELTVNVDGANGEDGTLGQRKFKMNVRCNGDATQTVQFINSDTIDENELPADGLYYPLSGSERLYSYKSIFISLSENDSFAYDNTYSIYGGEKPVVRVQYTSTMVNRFVNGALLVLQNYYQDQFELQISEVKLDNHETPETFGYDFYIYEHWVPAQLPADGVKLLMDPPVGTMPSGTDFMPSGVVPSSGIHAPMAINTDSPLLRNIKAEDITVSRYTRLSTFVGYDVLMTCDSFPMLLSKDEGSDKIMVMPFSLHYSNFGVSMYFPLFMNNVFEHFFPVMTDGFVFEIGDSVSLKGRGESLVLKGADNSEVKFETFPSEYIFTVPGTYEVSQDTYYSVHLSENIFVKIPAKESNICVVETTLKRPLDVESKDDGIDDLLVWFAAALVALLFIDWLLQIRSTV